MSGGGWCVDVGVFRQDVYYGGHRRGEGSQFLGATRTVPSGEGEGGPHELQVRTQTHPGKK